MNAKYIVAVFIAVLAASAAVAVADGSDATNEMSMGTAEVSHEFKENTNGTITVNISNNTPNKDATVTVVAKEGNDVKATKEVEISAGSSKNVELTFTLGAGTHVIATSATAVLTDGETVEELDAVPGSGATVTIDVDQSIWSGWVPYVVLVIVALIVVLMIYIWYRGRPAPAPAVTFNDLESGKVKITPNAAQTTEKKRYVRQEKNTDKPETERSRYLSSRRK